MLNRTAVGLSRGSSHPQAPEQVDGWMVGTLGTSPSASKPDHDNHGLWRFPLSRNQSSRKTFSRRSWRSCASSDRVAMGRASRRFKPIGSPVSSQYPYVPSSMRASAASILATSLRWRSRALQFERAIGLRCGAIGQIGVLREILVQHVQRLPVLPDDLFLPSQQLVAEVGPVPLVHERFVLGRLITPRERWCGCSARAVYLSFLGRVVCAAPFV